MDKGNLPLYRFTFHHHKTDQIGLWTSGSKDPHLYQQTCLYLNRYTALLPLYYRFTALLYLNPSSAYLVQCKALEDGRADGLSRIALVRCWHGLIDVCPLQLVHRCHLLWH